MSRKEIASLKTKSYEVLNDEMYEFEKMREQSLINKNYMQANAHSNSIKHYQRAIKAITNHEPQQTH